MYEALAGQIVHSQGYLIGEGEQEMRKVRSRYYITVEKI